MKIFSLSILDSFNKFLNLVVGITVITSLVALFDFSNQHAKVSFDVFTVAVWIDESAIIKYYEVHNYKMPDILVKYLSRSGRLVIPNLEKAISGKYDYYYPDDELLPNSPAYENYEIEKKLQLQSYYLFGLTMGGSAYPANTDEWLNQLLPEVKKLSKTEGRKLELAILEARRVENMINLKNEGDLSAKSIKLYINVIRNLVSGPKGSILSIMSLIPGQKPIIEDYRAEFNLLILKPKCENQVTVITREAPIFLGNIDVDYETQRIVNFRRLATVFVILLMASLVIIMFFSLVSKRNKETIRDS
ncbi:MAG: hypothetical protein MUO78_09975 [candidate division Zixibacteria bacterium]|nr:hypothetical protein [candidate division Zixibacteria bacterium]